MKPTPYYFEWVDSISLSNRWQYVDDLVEETKHRTEQFATIGYLANENDEEYVIASSVHFTGETTPLSYSGLIIIPKVAVVKKYKIKDLPELKRLK